MNRKSSRQRSKLSVPIPTARATTSIAALSGSSNRATALLFECLSVSSQVRPSSPSPGLVYGGDNYSDESMRAGAVRWMVR